jgi:protocatechuate 3,4-dioxygenase, alpha subunit
MNILTQTPSQTLGPFFAYGLTPQQYGYDFAELLNNMQFESTKAPKITIVGAIYDGNGEEIPDAIVEIWQPLDNTGQRADHEGIARSGTGTEAGSKFIFETIKPSLENGQLPFISLVVLMRGLLIHVYTRIYFDDEPVANALDYGYSQVPNKRKETLLARKTGENEYSFDIYMQGEKETVFFEFID